jgi:hypothetical protein
MITLTINTIISAVKRHLSIIGKRLYTKDGRNMFSDITLSSAEDTQILTQYINGSAQDTEAALKQFITSSSYGPVISMDIQNTRGDSDFDNRVQDLSQSYVTLNTVGEYLSMLHPDLAQKYQADARQRMDALMIYVFYKNPPTKTTHKYPTGLDVNNDPIELEIGETHAISYTIPDDCIDDMEITSEDDKIIDAGRMEDGFAVKGKLRGHTYVTIFSRHNESVSDTIHIYVTDHR